jgi:maltokinase
MTDVARSIDPRELLDWMVAQRWFASKAREVAQIEVLEAVALREEPPLLVLALVEARFPTGTHERYQVPLGMRRAADRWTRGVIDEVEGWTVYDAPADPVHAHELLHRMRAGDDVMAEEGALTFRWAEQADVGIGDTLEVRPMGVEQSNTSLVFGDSLTLKVFRRLEPGENPELELLRFLTARGFEHIAPLVGWYQFTGRLMDATLGILQEFLPGAGDGWGRALDDLSTDPEAFVDRARALGVVTAKLHNCLGSEPSDPAFSADEPSVEAISILTATVDEEIERIFVDMPDDERVAPIKGRGQDVRERLQTLSHIGAAGRVIRPHGDFHLGQTLWTPGREWTIIDFEGEPARPLPERRLKRSPLRDVAGMVRSFAYVASASEILHGRRAPDGWEERVRAAFLDGYFEHVDNRLLPPGQDATDRLISVFELAKAVYELRYELNNRPKWVGIPVAGIARLLEETA